MTRPSWLGRAVRNRHRHAIEQASRRWRGAAWPWSSAISRGSCLECAATSGDAPRAAVTRRCPQTHPGTLARAPSGRGRPGRRCATGASASRQLFQCRRSCRPRGGSSARRRPTGGRRRHFGLTRAGHAAGGARGVDRRRPVPVAGVRVRAAAATRRPPSYDRNLTRARAPSARRRSACPPARRASGGPRRTLDAARPPRRARRRPAGRRRLHLPGASAPKSRRCLRPASSPRHA